MTQVLPRFGTAVMRQARPTCAAGRPCERCAALLQRRDGGSCLGPAMPMGDAACTVDIAPGLARPRDLSGRAGSNWKHGYYSAEAKQVRRQALQQYRLLRQLIAAGNEDDVLDLISSIVARVWRPLTRQRPGSDYRGRYTRPSTIAWGWKV
jgi:hypothetical protein